MLFRSYDLKCRGTHWTASSPSTHRSSAQRQSNECIQVQGCELDKPTGNRQLYESNLVCEYRWAATRLLGRSFCYEIVVPIITTHQRSLPCTHSDANNPVEPASRGCEPTDFAAVHQSKWCMIRRITQRVGLIPFQKRRRRYKPTHQLHRIQH